MITVINNTLNENNLLEKMKKKISCKRQIAHGKTTKNMNYKA